MAVQLLELQRDQLNCPRLRGRSATEECDPAECNDSLLEFEGEEIRGCPVKQITQDSFEYIRAYKFYLADKYPRGGGFLDQGGRYIEAMEIIDTEMQKISLAREEQLKQNFKAGK